MHTNSIDGLAKRLPVVKSYLNALLSFCTLNPSSSFYDDYLHCSKTKQKMIWFQSKKEHTKHSAPESAICILIMAMPRLLSISFLVRTYHFNSISSETNDYNYYSYNALQEDARTHTKQLLCLIFNSYSSKKKKKKTKRRTISMVILFRVFCLHYPAN